ncbi:hypothetical protein OROMI_031325 [Orobanche minor]
MSRSTRSSTLLLVSVVLLLSTATISAFNITRILQRYPDFARFNSLLSQTHLAEEINHRKTITVLALTDDRIGDLSGKPEDVAKRILSTHVILDYYDVLKLNKLRGNKTVMTTLYQATGTADDQQGFLNVAHNNDGIFFGSAMRGAPIDSKLEGSVASQPYDISVLSISHPIVAPGIDGTWRPPPHHQRPPPPRRRPPPRPMFHRRLRRLKTICQPMHQLLMPMHRLHMPMHRLLLTHRRAHLDLTLRRRMPTPMRTINPRLVRPPPERRWFLVRRLD